MEEFEEIQKNKEDLNVWFVRVNSSEKSRTERGWYYNETIDNGVTETDLDTFPYFDYRFDNDEKIRGISEDCPFGIFVMNFVSLF